MLKDVKVIGYKKDNSFSSAVLESVLKMIAEKGRIEVVELLVDLRLQIDYSQSVSPNCSPEKNLLKKIFLLMNNRVENRAGRRFGANINPEAKPSQTKISKLALPITTDLIASKIVHEIINGNIDNLKKKNKKIITPLFLFLDKEVKLYAELKGLRSEKKEDLISPPPSRPPRGRENKIKSAQIKLDKDKISGFIDELEIKHPEIKRAIVNSIFKLDF